MKVLVVYDSQWGNTEQIAQAIGTGFEPEDEVTVVRPASVRRAHLEGLDLLLVGAPTHAGHPTKPVQQFLAGLDDSQMRGMRAAAFDTRVASRFARIFGYAAPRIAHSLRGKGAMMVVEPEPFIVKASPGPLEPGEGERAMAWAKSIRSKIVDPHKG